MSGQEVVRFVLSLKDSPSSRQQLAEAEAARTDPWRWYCRICGAEGESPDRCESRLEAFAHIGDDPTCGGGYNVGEASTGRLLHVWTY